MGFLDELFSALQRPPNSGRAFAPRAVRLIEKTDSWSVDVPAGGTAEIMGRVTAVPETYRKIALYCGTLLAWGSIYWRTLENGAVKMIFRDPIGFPGLPGSIAPLSISQGNRISVEGVNNTANPVSMGITLTWDEEHRG